MRTSTPRKVMFRRAPTARPARYRTAWNMVKVKCVCGLTLHEHTRHGLVADHVFCPRKGEEGASS